MGWLRERFRDLMRPAILPGAVGVVTVPDMDDLREAVLRADAAHERAGTPAERGAAWASQNPLYDQTVLATGVLPGENS